ncbi:uncharacterized protein A1O9_02896 [Exophiala aquamarina CBS 119918]|uniref:Cyclin N-terminal domain-containing protein n=1 Tax=Exophiala aquamarina CBS 119918 TaxID=1182545 RepID=A0A072PN88_9EURO|nr:uncharacterized protein A1O9_02896 [Exophiala aquamarina CBS 119918]KEF61331.1 hypothetical protein A1O9_02896 [Exophiala aquamarina CBS 119918]
MGPIQGPDHLTNSLATTQQLFDLSNREGEDGPSIRFALVRLTSAAGILLRLPQEAIAQAIVLLLRFLLCSRPHDRESFSAKTYSAASIYLSAKISTPPVSPRSVVNVYAYLTSNASPLSFINPGERVVDDDPKEYFVSEGTYDKERQQLFVCESMILAGLGFDTHVALPHGLALTYLQALGVSTTSLAKRVFEHLNGALLSPQLLYLTHQPNALAVGAIYLAAREIDVKLVDQNWWEVFDVDREDLGFLVLALGSLETFAAAERDKWAGKTVPLD